MNKRTAREINVSQELLTNKDINIKIGTVENRNCPETVYVYISFWITPNETVKHKIGENDTLYFKHKLKTFLESIYTKNFVEHVINPGKYFISERENIFIYNIPENFNYNNKPSFISLELYLHTANLKKKQYPLNVKKDTELFIECLRIGNKIGDKINNLSSTYNVSGIQKKLLN